MVVIKPRQNFLLNRGLKGRTSFDNVKITRNFKMNPCQIQPTLPHRKRVPKRGSV